MARVCDICRKRTVFGNNISHSHKRTRRTWRPNLHKIRVVKDGKVVKLKVCTKCLRKLPYPKAVKVKTGE